MRFKIVNCKAQIAANSGTIGKICNAAVDDFKLIDAVHDLIRGSLTTARIQRHLTGFLLYYISTFPYSDKRLMCYIN